MLVGVSAYTLLELAAIIIVLSATWFVLTLLKVKSRIACFSLSVICVLLFLPILQGATDTRQLQRELSSVFPWLTASNGHLALMLYFLCKQIYWAALWVIGACILMLVFLWFDDKLKTSDA